MLLFTPSLHLGIRLRRASLPPRTLGDRKRGKPLHHSISPASGKGSLVGTLTGYFLEGDPDGGLKRLSGVPIGIGEAYGAAAHSHGEYRRVNKL